MTDPVEIEDVAGLISEETSTAPTRVKLMSSVPGRYLSRPLKEWEKNVGLDQSFVGEEDEFYRVVLHGRPRTRRDCKNVPRPCPFVGCRHHLWMELLPSSRDIKPNLSKALPWEMPHASCSLDVADANPNGMTLLDIGRYFKISRERIRQVETIILKQMLSTLGELFGRDHFSLDNAYTDEYGENMPDKVKAKIGIK